MRCGFCLCAPACSTRRLPAAVVRRQEDGSCAIPAQEDRALVDRRASARAQASSVHAPHPRGLGLQEPTAMRKAKVSCRPSSRVADTAARGGQARLSFSHSVRCCQVRRPHACRMQESARHSWSVVDTVSAFWPECSSRLPLGFVAATAHPDPLPHSKRQLLTLRRHSAPSRTVPRCAKCEGQRIESRQTVSA